MSTVAPRPEPAADPVTAVARAFQGALAARRRMRSREPHGPAGLGDARYSLLFWLREGSGMPAGELAVAADLSPASTTEMLESLESAGLVQRVRSESDRRVVLTSLTPQGEALVEQRRARFEPRLRAALAGFSERELRSAVDVLQALREMYDAPEPPA